MVFKKIKEFNWKEEKNGIPDYLLALHKTKPHFSTRPAIELEQFLSDQLEI